MQDALPAIENRPQTNLLFRDDTLFGVCEGIGEDFGFHANFLRVPLAAGILWNPAAMVGIYLALGVSLALARWLYPKPTSSAVAPVTLQLADGHVPAKADNADAERLSIAA